MLIQARNVNRQNKLDDGGKRMEEVSATRERFSRARERNEEREEKSKIRGETGRSERTRELVCGFSPADRRPCGGGTALPAVAHGGPPPILAYRLITEKTAGIPGTPRDMYRAFSCGAAAQSAITHRSRRARVVPMVRNDHLETSWERKRY